MLDGLKMEESLQSALDPAAPFSSLLGKSEDIHPAPPGWGTAGRAPSDGHRGFRRGPGAAFPRARSCPQPFPAPRRSLRPGSAPGARLPRSRFVPRLH